MKDFKIITRENVPWWYELDWLPTSKHGPTITIRIRKNILAQKIFQQRARTIDFLQNDFGLPDFVPYSDSATTYGFGGHFIWDEADDESRTLVVPIPIIGKLSDKPCPSCNGTGYDAMFERVCLYCRGKKNERWLDWPLAHAISATFTILLTYLDFPNVTWKSGKYQLLTLKTITQHGQGGGSLSGRYSIKMARWLASLPQGSSLPEMVGAMKVAYVRMLDQDRSLNRFSASINDNNGWLNVNCPGDACSLNPDHNGIRLGHGYDWSCHNTDTPIQQLTLIAGLSALHKRARQEGV